MPKYASTPFETGNFPVLIEEQTIRNFYFPVFYFKPLIRHLTRKVVSEKILSKGIMKGADRMIDVSLIDPKRLIDQGFPASVRSQLVAAIYRGYAMVEALKNDVDLLKWEVGYDLLGHLRRVAVEFEIKRLIDNGNIPQTYQYRIGWNAAQNCRHLEVFNERCVVTISQVQQPGAIPRLAIFRKNLGVGNSQLAFDFENGVVNDNCCIDAQNNVWYFLLTHGYGRAVPDFVFLGIPVPDVRSWIFRLNLLSEPRLFYPVPEELIEPNDIVSLKQYVRETLTERKL